MRSATRKKIGSKSSFGLVRPLRATAHLGQIKSERLNDILVIAERKGLLRGTRTKVIRGRMPEALVTKAKARTGIKSDTDLLEMALANLAVADDYPDWLLSRRGTIPQDLDLEF